MPNSGEIFPVDTILCGDCLQLMKQIPTGSVDMILCDLPYGTTACSWDIVIPFEPLWEQYKRVIKRNGAIVLTGSEPFSSYLRLSNIGWYKYDWIWDKSLAGNPFIAKYQPLKIHETISVFSDRGHYYNPIMRTGVYKQKGGGFSKLFGVECSKQSNDQYYPQSILRFTNGDRSGKLIEHPTQKPVDLFAYLIRTYTNEGELVLDNCCGSGTTAVAAIQTGRHYLCIEQSPDYVAIAERRVLSARQQLTLNL